MTKKNTAPSGKLRAQTTELDSRYGEIGISAVAAALHYQSDAKNPAYAPAEPQRDQRFEDTAEAAA